MHNNPLKERLVKGDHAFGTMAFEFFTPVCRKSFARLVPSC